MNIALINKATNICENIAVFEDIETAITMFGEDYSIVEIEAGYGIGDTYKSGIWTKAEQQEQESQTMLYRNDGTGLSLSGNQAITVDTASKKWLDIPQKVAQFLMKH